MTRRQTFHFAAALGAGAMLGTASSRQAVSHTMIETAPATDDAFVHPEALINVATLQDRMADPTLVLVGFMPTEEFGAGHIPGSVQIDWPELEVIDTSDASIESWQQSVAEMVGERGITPNSTVVAYDNGTLLSARFWWILHFLGHENVHILDGGLPAWGTAGNEVQSGSIAIPGGPAYAGMPNPGLLAQRDEVLAILEEQSSHFELARTTEAQVSAEGRIELLASLNSPPVAIVDARTVEEYAEGHIPGAVNLNFPLNAATEPPKCWKSAAELRSMYEEIGVTEEKLVIPYCASGVRSAVTAFSLHLLGFESVALYTGSWLEWGKHPDTPKAQATHRNHSTTTDRPLHNGQARRDTGVAAGLSFVCR